MKLKYYISKLMKSINIIFYRMFYSKELRNAIMTFYFKYFKSKLFSDELLISVNIINNTTKKKLRIQYSSKFSLFKLRSKYFTSQLNSKKSKLQ